MSLSDRAFIKAYRKESPAAYQPEVPEPGLPPGAYIEVPGVPEADSEVAVSARSQALQHRIDSAHDSAVPAPHIGRSREAAGAGSAAAAHRVPRPPEFGSPQPSVPESPPFLADWEVDRFVWPEICKKLLSSEAAYFRAVGEQLRSLARSKRQVLMIGGCRRGEGRTTMALCLARSAARAGVSVGLIDGDLGNPRLASRLGIDPAYGWLEVLAEKTPLEEAAVRSLEEPVTLFPLTQSSAVEPGLGENPLLPLVPRIAGHFPLVIVDLGPRTVETTREAAGRERPRMMAVVLRDVRHTPAGEAQRQARQLGERGIETWGIVENFHSA